MTEGRICSANFRIRKFFPISVNLQWLRAVYAVLVFGFPKYAMIGVGFAMRGHRKGCNATRPCKTVVCSGHKVDKMETNLAFTLLLYAQGLSRHGPTETRWPRPIPLTPAARLAWDWMAAVISGTWQMTGSASCRKASSLLWMATLPLWSMEACEASRRASETYEFRMILSELGKACIDSIEHPSP